MKSRALVLVSVLCGCFLAPDSTGLWSDIDLAEYDHLGYASRAAPNQYYDAFVESGVYDYSELGGRQEGDPGMVADFGLLASYGTLCTTGECLQRYEEYKRDDDNILTDLCVPFGCNLFAARIRNDSLFIGRQRDRLANVAGAVYQDWLELFQPFGTRKRPPPSPCCTAMGGMLRI